MFYIVLGLILLLAVVGFIFGGSGAHVMGPGMFILFGLYAVRWYIAVLLVISAIVTFYL